MKRSKSLRRSRKTGLPPGTLMHIGEDRTEPVHLTAINYTGESVQEQEVFGLDDLRRLRKQPGILWLNLDGIHQVDILEKVTNFFGLHPLVQEDILNTSQRPKTEDYNSYLYVVLRMPVINGSKEWEEEQISLVIGKDFVLSFQERRGDVFNFVRDRLRNDKGKIRKEGADYLGYALLDSIVDSYFGVLEQVGERIEALEDEVVTNPAPELLNRIYEVKNRLVRVRRAVWPLREVVSGLEKGISPLITPPTRIFLRDVYDHTVQVVETVETYRDLTAGMLDIYLSSSNNRLNEVMKVLTIIATIFIPLTFISGVYGMNFKYIPETQWDYGYFYALGLMLAVTVLMLVFFRHKKWF